ncbi:alanine--tRNA ligase, chloroplastic/mitochondrial isoform X2, partial [Tanacetum coccineum]
STQPVIVDHVEETSQDDLPTSGNSIRRRYLEFYQKKGHTILRSSSLVPDNEDTDVLLTIAGMLQFKPIFLGKKMGEEDNFWTSGETGPCGPCSEIYYDFHPERGYSDVDLNDDTRFIEFYNLVFMEFYKNEDCSIEQLKEKNIDTIRVPNNYETDLIFPIMEEVAELAKVSYADVDDSTKTKLKVIGDHMRAIVCLISDGLPSPVLRGYVVRRLIRRSLRMGYLLGICVGEKGNLKGEYLPVIAETVIAISSEINPDLKSRKSFILEELEREESRFNKTLEKGEKHLQAKLDDALENARLYSTNARLSGKDAFHLYSTYGYPIEMTIEGAHERGVS